MDFKISHNKEEEEEEEGGERAEDGRQKSAQVGVSASSVCSLSSCSWSPFRTHTTRLHEDRYLFCWMCEKKEEEEDDEDEEEDRKKKSRSMGERPGCVLIRERRDRAVWDESAKE